MAKQSKATKVVIASLLATSAIVPAMAVSAEVGGTVTKSTDTTTTAATQTIDFKVEDATGHLGNYIKGPGKLVEMSGKKYIEIAASDALLAMITSATVDGKSIIIEHSGKKHIYVPVTEEYAPVTIELEVLLMGNPLKSTATLTPDKSTITGGETETKPEEPKEEKLFTPKEYKSVANGSYDVKWDAYKGNVGNYTSITGQLSPNAKLVVKEGKYFVEISTIAKSNHMITAITVEGKEAEVISGTANEGDVRVFSFEIDSIGDLHAAKIDLNVGGGRMMSHDFGFAIETANLVLPEVGTTPEVKPEEPTATTAPVYVYKDGTNELSIMHNKYLDDEVTITETAAGYDVDVTFPEGQHLIDFKVEGATVALKSEEVEGANTVKIYTVSVGDLSTIYNATADLKVVVNGATLYETKHALQLQFGGKQNPFTDIVKDGHYGYIVNLYSADIFKEADKFNPKDPLKRYQFALMLNRALDLDVPATTNFTDIAKLDAETQDAVKALNAYGIINGTTATTFGAGDGIKRQHAALMIYRLLVKNGYEPTGATANFTDLPKDAEAVKAIAELNHLGIMTGYQGKVTPNAVLTRSQMAKIVNNSLNVLEGLK
ncbi:S-layer homology domain-containing protein [Solibacillus sp. FSL R7-0682]|uniref:S-layer homology domain-containing protein n=1 Tax=Solibacillus sp. FSL R7-0682 TaxID=2921690 RepID=UPI0030F5E777